MNVGIGTEAAQFHSLGIVVSNFRYTVFVVWLVSSRRELNQHGVLPSLAGGICPDRCDLHRDVGFLNSCSTVYYVLRLPNSALSF